jgi:hypothetical protein
MVGANADGALPLMLDLRTIVGNAETQEDRLARTRLVHGGTAR